MQLRPARWQRLEIESSVLLYAAPELVRGRFAAADHDVDPHLFLLVQGVSAYARSGVARFPSLATAANGKAVLESMATSFAAHLSVLG
ncbi:creatininase family protein [Streptomyces cyaneofuscatus]|uniref:creatininase family protein n=1 Tax=Streptomyces cyaneofuscatus TaxID=66883 RepID=UPI00386FFC06